MKSKAFSNGSCRVHGSEGGRQRALPNSPTKSSSATQLIPPGLQVRARRCALHDAVDDLGGVELMVAESGDCVGASVVAAPAVFGAGFVIDFAAIERVLCRLEKIVDQVHGVIQKVIVRLADVDVDLAFSFRSEL